MDAIQFFAAGIPKAQPRPRAFARFIGGKAVARVYEAGTAEAWKGDIARAAQRHRPARPIEGPIRVDIHFIFPRPKRLLKKKSPAGRIEHTAKPDRDNLDKAALDCLTTLGFWPDDAAVCKGGPEKSYAAIGEQPGAHFIITPLHGGPHGDADAD
jgi:Holliday junction resolvase RusA-like endonuclease